MADSLAGRAGHNGTEDANPAEFFEFKDAYNDADEECRRAVAARKDLRAKIKAAGIPLASWDRWRRDTQKSGAVRENEDVWYRRMMIWDLKPVGFQASADFTSTDPGMAALNTSELHRIDMEGLAAGKAGHRRDSNSYTPGTEAFQRWDTAWMRGDAERTPAGDAAANGGIKRGRGRPRKDASAAAPAAPKRGRAARGAAATADRGRRDEALDPAFTGSVAVSGPPRSAPEKK